LRCFIACFVEPASALALRGACPEIPAVRWIATDNYHVTLHFLGEVSEHEVPALMDLVETLSPTPGQHHACQAEELTGYPNSARARAVVARLRADATLTNWSTQLRERCVVGNDGGRNFEAHITVARRKRGVQVPVCKQLAGLRLKLTPPALYRSVTLSTGARYEQLARNGLAPMPSRKRTVDR
jgi:2'-5' RNA ligase